MLLGGFSLLGKKPPVHEVKSGHGNALREFMEDVRAVFLSYLGRANPCRMAAGLQF